MRVIVSPGKLPLTAEILVCLGVTMLEGTLPGRVPSAFSVRASLAGTPSGIDHGQASPSAGRARLVAYKSWPAGAVLSHMRRIMVTAASRPCAN